MRNAQLIPERATATIVRDWKRRNLRHRVRDYRQEIAHRTFPLLGIPALLSELQIKVLRKDGSIEDYGVVGRRVVTTVGVGAIAAAFNSLFTLSNFNYHDAGTGTNAAVIGDTVLQTPWGGARSAGTQSNPSNGLYRSVATITFNNTFAITEWGIFSASSVGSLLDRFVFAALNVVSGDAIQGTFTITFTAGG